MKKNLFIRWLAMWLVGPILMLLVGIIFWPLLLVAVIGIPIGLIMIPLFPLFYKLDSNGMKKFLRYSDIV